MIRLHASSNGEQLPLARPLKRSSVTSSVTDIPSSASGLRPMKLRRATGCNTRVAHSMTKPRCEIGAPPHETVVRIGELASAHGRGAQRGLGRETETTFPKEFRS